MTTTHSHRTHRQIDVANLAVTAISIISGLFSYLLIAYADANALILIPSVAVGALSSTHLVKRTAIRE